MLIEDAARATLRNLSTLFLVAGLVVIPLHLTYSFVFKQAVEVRELHDEISELPARRQIRNVSSGDVVAFRLTGVGLIVLELALVPFVASIARQVVKTDQRGGIPTAFGAWRNGRGGWRDGFASLRTASGPVLFALIVTLVLAWLWERTALMVVDAAIPDARSFAFFGLAQGVARSLAAPFLLATIALVPSTAKGVSRKAPNLYSGRT